MRVAESVHEARKRTLQLCLPFRLESIRDCRVHEGRELLQLLRRRRTRVGRGEEEVHLRRRRFLRRHLSEEGDVGTQVLQPHQPAPVQHPHQREEHFVSRLRHEVAELLVGGAVDDPLDEGREAGEVHEAGLDGSGVGGGGEGVEGGLRRRAEQVLEEGRDLAEEQRAVHAPLGLLAGGQCHPLRLHAGGQEERAEVGVRLVSVEVSRSPQPGERLLRRHKRHRNHLELEGEVEKAPLGRGVDALGGLAHEGDGGEGARPGVVDGVVEVHNAVQGIAEGPPLLEHEFCKGKLRQYGDGELRYALAHLQKVHVHRLPLLVLVLLRKQPEEHTVHLPALCEEHLPRLRSQSLRKRC
mmetsp:Transcript_15114/g.59168  ORF Transcript_15114/g.59168 Transcript_15114/m.59168 type:complete len:354 (+) Transcript_15114:1602-2663(+)